MRDSRPGWMRMQEANCPNLATIKSSLRTLYKSLSSATVSTYDESLDPEAIQFPEGKDTIIAVQLVASAIVKHYDLPLGCIIVNFRDMEIPGQVELTPENNYLIDLHPRYLHDHRDIAAVLVHEVAHVFLYRHGIHHSDSREHEILTDTATMYLGAGWPVLNADRVTHTQRAGPTPETVERGTLTERLGYLTPYEYGYIIGKRTSNFDEQLGREQLTLRARKFLNWGIQVAQKEETPAPLQQCFFLRRLGYWWNRRFIKRMHRRSGLSGRSRMFDGYQFEVDDKLSVIFECTRCTQRLRVPTGRSVEARCGNCGKPHACDT